MTPSTRATFVEVLGHLAVTGPDGRLEGAALAGRQGRIVVSALVAAGRPVHRDVLADRVWGANLPTSWTRDLSSVVSRLRAALQQVGVPAAEVLVGRDGSYGIDPAAADADLWRLRGLVPAAEAALAAGSPGDARIDAQHAADLARAGFLPNEQAAWVDDVRAELEMLHLRAREVAAEAAARAGDSADALRRFTELAVEVPLNERVYRRLVELNAALGNRAEAVAVYERLRAALAHELGVDPSPETERLFLRVLRDRADTTASKPPPAPSRGRMREPATEYARSGLVNVAYQVVGDGPDLIVVPGWVSNVELLWEEPRANRFLHRLAARCRVILFDKRGTGLSDPVPIERPPTLDERLDDVRTVMDAAGAANAALLGFSEGGTLAILAAASHPERVRRLVLWGAWARQLPTDDFPYGWTREQGLQRFVRPIQKHGQVDPRWFAPSVADDPEFAAWFASYARQSASPGMAISLLRANAQLDVRLVLPSVRVPTLVLHHTDDILVEVGQGRYLAEHIPGARLREHPGRDHWPWIGADADDIVDEIIEAVTVPDTIGDLSSTTVLATIVAAAVPETQQALEELEVHGGRLFLQSDRHLVAGFDRPGRALDCALRWADDGGRAGVHTGEVTTAPSGERGGPGPEVARRLLELAEIGEVLVTRPVTDLLVGGDRDLVLHEPDPGLRWPVYVARSGR